MRIQTRLLLSSAVTLATVLTFSGWAVVDSMQDAAVDDAVRQAEAVAAVASEARDHVSRMHDDGSIDLERLLQGARQEMAESGGDYRSTAAFRAIPVIVGIESAMGAAKASGIDVTVTANDARNPEYDPGRDSALGEVRGQLLDRLTAQVRAGGEHSLWCIDDASDTLVFQSAITLEKGCMLCHGDPADSKTGDGKDPLGFAMENWRVGDVHGAFEVRTALAPVRAAARSAAFEVAGIGFLCGLGGLGVLHLLMRRFLGRPIGAAVEKLRNGEGDLTIRLDDSRDDELGELGSCCNRFFEQVQTIVRSVASSADGVLASAGQLDTGAKGLSQAAAGAGQESSRVAAAAEELSANVSGVGTSTQAMTASYRTVAAAVEEITASISEVA
ncbi:MAG: methyl-accepting chemotaxis protein, partial [Planctomycetes bacterium]|nr:methyl-accepting chemotaxis protein [Planctomycetota bacterium]